MLGFTKSPNLYLSFLSAYVPNHSTLWPSRRPDLGNIGALITRIGFGVYYTIVIIRSP